MTWFFRKVCEKVSDHLDFIRYLWPDKNISTRFKFLNFLSADWLRTGVNGVRGGIYRLNMHTSVYSRSVESDDPLNPEQMDKVLQLICKDLDYLERKTDDLFKI